MPIKLNGSGSGSVALNAPANTSGGSDISFTLPTADGTSGQVLQTNGSGALSFASASSDNITEGNTSAEVVDTGSDGHFKVTTEGTERLRVIADGKVGVGISSPQADLHVGSTSESRNGILRLGSNGTYYSQIEHKYADNELRINAAGGGQFISFYTNTERVRIDSSGRTGFGTAPNFNSENALITLNGTNYARNIYSHKDGTAATANFTFANGNGAIGSITTSGVSTAYNTSSDYRLKENVIPLTGAADRISQLQVHRFNFISDPDKTVDGFIAHEAQAVVPECVFGEKDEVDADGNPVYQGIDQSKLVPLLTAALQEALAKLETLEAANAALEARLTALEGGAS